MKDDTRSTVTVIPAHHGWQRAWFWWSANDDRLIPSLDELELRTIPVIAWIVMQENKDIETVESLVIKVITPFGEDINDMTKYLLIDPEGVFHFGFEDGSGNEAEAKEYWIERERNFWAERQRKARTAAERKST